MLDCSARIQSQIGHGLLIFHSYPLLNLTTNPRPLADTTQPCLHLRLHRSTTDRFFLQCLSSSSSPRDSPNPISSTDYIVRSLALSPESASELRKRKHKSIELNSTSNADSVLALFRDYGFTDTQMATIFSVCAVYLSYDPLKVFKPKFDIFAQNGISGDNLVRIITSDPSVLRRSLRRIMVPCFDFLRFFFGRDSSEAVVSLFSVRRGTSVLHNFSDTTAPNVAALRRCGVPDANIVKLFIIGVRTLSRGTDEFVDILREVREMGFDPESLMFIYGLRTFTMVKKETWVSKMDLLKKSFGWTDEQAQALFVKEPNFMALSEERLKEGLELFMNRLEWTADDIAKYPSLLNYSFDNRIYPRLSVLKILMSKGLKKRTCMGHAFKASEGVFLRMFVERYEEEIPELLEVYRQNMRNRKALPS